MRFLTFFGVSVENENPQKVGGYERGGHDFGSIFARSSDMPPNHNENLFRTYELLMLADIHVGFRPFLKNIFSTEVRSRGHFSSPSEAIPYQYTEGQRDCSKNRPKIRKTHWRQNRFRSQRVFIQKL